MPVTSVGAVCRKTVGFAKHPIFLPLALISKLLCACSPALLARGRDPDETRGEVVGWERDRPLGKNSRIRKDATESTDAGRPPPL